MALCSQCKGITVNSIVPYCHTQSTLSIDFPDEDSVRARYNHRPTYNALRTSSQTCRLCQLFYHVLELKNRGKETPSEFKANDASSIWLISGGEMFFDLRRPKHLSQIRLNVGNGTLMNSADLSITTYASGYTVTQSN
jgi:hypothetical protein